MTSRGMSILFNYRPHFQGLFKSIDRLLCNFRWYKYPTVSVQLIKSVATASNNPKNERTYPRCPLVRRLLRFGIGNTIYILLFAFYQANG